MAKSSTVLITLFSSLIPNFVSALPITEQTLNRRLDYSDLETPKLYQEWLADKVAFYSGPFLNRDECEYKTDQLLYNTSLHDFELIRAAIVKDEHAPPPENKWDIDWTSDACTIAADNPWTFHFKPVCQRADLARKDMKRHGRDDGCGYVKARRLRTLDYKRACSDWVEAHKDERSTYKTMDDYCYISAFWHAPFEDLEKLYNVVNDHVNEDVRQKYKYDDDEWVYDPYEMTCSELELGPMSWENIKLRPF